MTRTRQWAALAIGFGWLIVATCWGPATVVAQNIQPGPVIDLAGEWAAQVFLHYVDRTGPHAGWKFDKRPSLAAFPFRPGRRKISCAPKRLSI